MGGVGRVVAQIRHGIIQRSWPYNSVSTLNEKTGDNKSHLVLVPVKGCIGGTLAVF